MNFSNATAWDLNSDGSTQRTRTFNVTDTGTVHLGAQLVSSGILGVTITKTGDGTLVLANPNNSFTGPISITGGVLSISADGNLGNAINTVSMSAGGTQATGVLQVTGTFASNRDFNMSGGGQYFDVTGANIFTINNSVTGGNGLAKLDTGTLVLGGNANTLLVSV